jgi:hypothetical protein
MSRGHVVLARVKSFTEYGIDVIQTGLSGFRLNRPNLDLDFATVGQVHRFNWPENPILVNGMNRLDHGLSLLQCYQVRSVCGHSTAIHYTRRMIPWRQAHMIKEHDCVILTQDVPSDGLKAGDVGAVVHVHQASAGYEVEFMTLAGETIALATLLPAQVRAVAKGDLLHVRELQSA